MLRLCLGNFYFPEGKPAMERTWRKRKPLTPAQITEYKLKHPGITQEEIASIYGVTPARVSQVKHQAPGYRTPREIAMEHYPWTVGREFNGQALRQYSSDHLEYMATSGKGMSDRKLRRLRQFYNRLKKNNWVVEFNPESGGFSYQKKGYIDGDLIIRVNEFTAPLSEEGLALWQMPPRLPEVR